MPTRYAGAPKEVRALSAFIKLMRASESLAARLGAALAGTGVTHGQLAVLEALLHVGPMSQRDLGRKLLRSDANVCTVADNLEKAGLITRERRADDRRLVEVSLTKKGRQLIQGLFPGHARRVTEMMGVLSAEEQELLGRLCKKLGLGVASAE